MLDTVQDCTIVVRDINHEDDSASPCHCPFILPRLISPNVGLLRRRDMKSALRFEASNRGIHQFRGGFRTNEIVPLRSPGYFDNDIEGADAVLRWMVLMICDKMGS
jgi:hypothetical protein